MRRDRGGGGGFRISRSRDSFLNIRLSFLREVEGSVPPGTCCTVDLNRISISPNKGKGAETASKKPKVTFLDFLKIKESTLNRTAHLCKCERAALRFFFRRRQQFPFFSFLFPLLSAPCASFPLYRTDGRTDSNYHTEQGRRFFSCNARSDEGMSWACARCRLKKIRKDGGKIAADFELRFPPLALLKQVWSTRGTEKKTCIYFKKHERLSIPILLALQRNHLRIAR